MTQRNWHRSTREDPPAPRFHSVTVPTSSEGLRNALRSAFAQPERELLPEDFARLLSQLG